MTKYPFTAIINGLTYTVGRDSTKRSCPYCGYETVPGTKACACHKDLLRLDLAQTGWQPK